MVLVTGEEFYGALVPAAVAAIFPNANPNDRVAPSGDSDAQAFVFVNDGRWMVKCPTPNCGGAQVAFDGDRRFFCAGPDGCNNAVTGGQYVQVIWPSDADRLVIEQLLAPRSVPNRHWFPGESLESLAAENAANGVG